MEIIQKDFASADGDGYIVLDPQVLHAGNYGVPETRERVIFIGIRKSALNEKAMQMLSKEFVPSEYNPYPMPTHNFNVNDESLLPPVVCRDVFEGLQEPEYTKDISQMYYSRAKYRGKRLQGQNEINMWKSADKLWEDFREVMDCNRIRTTDMATYTLFTMQLCQRSFVVINGT